MMGGAVDQLRAWRLGFVSGRLTSSSASRSLNRVVRAPGTWIATLVALSTVLRAIAGLQVESVWILPDEVLYSELAKSIAAGTRPSIREIPVLGWGEVYPTLVAPAWLVFDDPVKAHHAALAINSFVMSLAAVPAYYLARLVVSARSAVVVAAMTLLVPSMVYTGVVMTENAFYPVFLLAVYLMARAVQNPSLFGQALALLGLVLVVFTRVQGVALAGAYIGAILLYSRATRPTSRLRYLRRFVPTALVVGIGCLGPVAVSVVGGEGPFGWLGGRSGTSTTSA